RKYFITLVLINTAIAAPAVVPPFIYKGFIDIITYEPLVFDNAVRVFQYIGLYVFVQIIENLLDSLDWYFSIIWRRTIRDGLVVDVMSRAFTVEQTYYQDKTIGEIVEKINNGIQQATGMYLFYPRELIEPLVRSIVSLTIITTIDVRIGLLLALLTPPYLFFHSKRVAANKEYLPQRREKEEKAAGSVTEALYSLESSKVNSNPKFILKKATKLLKQSFSIQKTQSKTVNLYGFAGELILNLAVAISLGFTAYNIYFGTMTLGDLVLVTTLSNNLLRPISRILQQQMRLQETIVGLERFFEILEAPVEQDRFKGLVKAKKLRGEIEIDSVSFGYDDYKQVLKNVSFVANPGENIALVGPSGSGKTTITKLISGLFVPQKGTITLDGVDITHYELDSIRKHIAVVFQDPFVFSDTLRNNLKYINPSASTKDITKVLKLANLQEFVKTLPKGLDTQVGERGVKLSGGQKQRLAIAQAFLKDAKIIIFDEATSALDSENEQLIKEAMQRLMADRTTFIISHRLATVLHADQILVLNKGKIIERGTHHELKAYDGLYNRLYTLQTTDPEKLEQLDLIE
ncbi:ABC transporter ATP-binding protein, partial [candidate division WWE3 bacterium]|nr:ABC transporter ATP-binding protein [candidate division WWE3 bacterium]